MFFLEYSVLSRLRANTDLSKVERSATNKIAMIKDCYEGTKTVEEWATNHNLPVGTVKHWYTQYCKMINTGINTFHDKGGRPPALDESSKQSIKEKVIQATRAQTSLTKRKFRELCGEEHIETLKRRNIACCNRKLHSKTIKTYFNSIEAATKQGQSKTNARIVAERDPRNAYSMHAMVAAYCEELVPHLIFNWDATQFVISPEGETVLVYIKGELDGPLTQESSGTLGYAIKLYHLHSAAGIPGPPVFVIADSTLGDSEYIVEKVLGLGNTNDPSAYGYLVFTKTRCCNKPFYEWYAHTVVAPFVKFIRDSYGCKVLI